MPILLDIYNNLFELMIAKLGDKEEMTGLFSRYQMYNVC